MAVVSVSKPESSRLDVLLRVQSGRLRVSDACALIGLRRRLLAPAPHGLIADDDAPMGAVIHAAAPRPHPVAQLDARRLRPNT